MAEIVMGANPTPEVAAMQERVRLHREAEISDRANEGLTSQVLQQALEPADFHSGRRMLANLPVDERAEVERAIFDLNPSKVLEIANKAIGPLPTRPEEINAELEGMRKRMREDRRGWFADDRAQLRYRALIRAADKT